MKVILEDGMDATWMERKYIYLTWSKEFLMLPDDSYRHQISSILFKKKDFWLPFKTDFCRNIFDLVQYPDNSEAEDVLFTQDIIAAQFK